MHTQDHTKLHWSHDCKITAVEFTQTEGFSPPKSSASLLTRADSIPFQWTFLMRPAVPVDRNDCAEEKDRKISYFDHAFFSWLGSSHQAGLSHRETPPLPDKADCRNQPLIQDETAVCKDFLYAEHIGIKLTPLLLKLMTVPWDFNIFRA